MHPVAAMQFAYTLWSREPEDGLLDTCRRLGIGFVAYRPLDRGFLTSGPVAHGELPEPDYRRDSPPFVGTAAQGHRERVDRLAPIAAAPGTKRRRWLSETVAASDLAPSPAVLADLEAAIARGSVAGDRYPERGMRSVTLGARARRRARPRRRPRRSPGGRGSPPR